jgi:hypothetical protein
MSAIQVFINQIFRAAEKASPSPYSAVRIRVKNAL